MTRMILTSWRAPSPYSVIRDVNATIAHTHNLPLRVGSFNSRLVIWNEHCWDWELGGSPSNFSSLERACDHCSFNIRSLEPILNRMCMRDTITLEAAGREDTLMEAHGPLILDEPGLWAEEEKAVARMHSNVLPDSGDVSEDRALDYASSWTSSAASSSSIADLPSITYADEERSSATTISQASWDDELPPTSPATSLASSNSSYTSTGGGLISRATMNAAAALPPAKQGRLLLVSLIENYCGLLEQHPATILPQSACNNSATTSPDPNSSGRSAIFHAICRHLSQLGIIRPADWADEMGHVRGAYRRAFQDLFHGPASDGLQPDACASCDACDPPGSPKHASRGRCEAHCPAHMRRTSSATPAAGQRHSIAGQSLVSAVAWPGMGRTSSLPPHPLSIPLTGSHPLPARLAAALASIPRSTGSTESPSTPCFRSLGSLEWISAAHSRYLQEFEELSLVGTGAFGHVFKVRNRIDSLLYAVKKIQFRAGSKSLREVKHHAKLNHDNVVRYFSAWIEDVDHRALDRTARLLCINGASDTAATRAEATPSAYPSSEGATDASSTLSSPLQSNEAPPENGTSPAMTLFLQMELCSHTLASHLKHRSTRTSASSPACTHPRDVDELECLHILRDICQGVEYLHAQGCIHRDVKPKNVYWRAGETFGNPGSWKIGDFGLVSSWGFASRCGLTTDPPMHQIAAQVTSNHTEQATAPERSTQPRLVERAATNRGMGARSPMLEEAELLMARKEVETEEETDELLSAPELAGHLVRTGINAAIPNDTFPDMPLDVSVSADAHQALSQLWAHTTGIGTVTYASPEQLSSLGDASTPGSSAAGSYTTATDIYSLGVLLVELFVPFATAMERAMVLGRLRGIPPVLPPEFVEVWPKQAELAMWMLQPEPAHRPTAAQVLGVVRQWELEAANQRALVLSPVSVPSAWTPAAPLARSSSLSPRVMRSLDLDGRENVPSSPKTPPSGLLEYVRYLERQLQLVQRERDALRWENKRLREASVSSHSRA
jgi:serine/threonine protein kinase